MSSTFSGHSKRRIRKPNIRLADVFIKNGIYKFEIQDFHQNVLELIIVETTPTDAVLDKRDQLLKLFKNAFPAIILTEDIKIAILYWARDKINSAKASKRLKAARIAAEEGAGDVCPGLMLAAEYNIPDNEDKEVAVVAAGAGIMSDNPTEVAAARDRMILNSEGRRQHPEPQKRLLRLGSLLQWDYLVAQPPCHPMERVERLATLARSIFILNWVSARTIAKKMLATMNMEYLTPHLIATLENKPKFEMYIDSQIESPEAIRFLTTGEGEIRTLLETIQYMWDF